MAFDNIVTPAQNIATARAAMDLTGVQYHVVQLCGTTVKLYTVATSGIGYALYNTPNSGEPCEIYGSPNVVKMKSSGTIPAGAFVSVTASAQAQVSDPASAGLNIGVAITAAVANDIFSVKLI